MAETPVQYPGVNAPLGVTLTEYVRTCKEKIAAMGLAPVRRSDLLEVLANKFAPDRFHGILEYGKVVMGLSKHDIEGLVQDLGIRCLEIGCKGKMLKKLMETYPFLDDVIRARVMKHLRLNLDDLPHWEDEEACAAYNAPLCRNFISESDFGLSLPLPPRPTVHHRHEGEAHADGGEDSEDEDLVSVLKRVSDVSV